MVDASHNDFYTVKVKYEQLCRELNMDRLTEEMAWKKYLEVSDRFSLEGDPMHWFCCALFAACRDSFTPTVGVSSSVIVGNCVSLTTLLRSCNISIYDFFSKIGIWHEMANMSRNFINQVNRLERIFSITFHLFKRFNEIFHQVFLAPKAEKKIKKYRFTKCSSSKLYELCWCLYLCAKNENPNYTVDVVTSFHLLICCIDLIYINVLSENRIDLINPDFEGVPPNWNTSQFEANSISRFCVITSLCRITKALPVEATSMKKNSWRAIIKEFFKTKTICGDENTFLGIVSNTNFERNLKSFNSSYEQFVLSVGEFDERILLNNPNYRKVNAKDLRETEPHHKDIKSLIPDTPLTRKNYLPENDVKEPVASATNNVMKLQEIADMTNPTEFLRQAGEAAITKINKKLSLMSQKFIENFPTKEEAEKRFSLAQSLYFYLLDAILRIEVRTKPDVDLKQLLQTDILNTALIACCIEIVLDAYNSHLEFPWILNCFKINAFHFCKIIEIVVGRHDGLLTRALIKHLNFIEEICLETLAWRKYSPLWEILENIDSPLPTWSEVDLENSRSRNEIYFNSSIYLCSEPANASDAAKRDLFNIVKESLPNGTLDNLKSQVHGNKRMGSLRIFLRKFYKLAWLRIKELCGELNLDGEIFLNKIWTLFEYSITQRSELMQDRHLDQILMCAIYLYIKVGEIEGKSFTDIMRFYRKQPQATSSTYREVLITAGNTDTDLEPKFGDIIFFYNNIYVQKMTPYALNFSEKKKSHNDLSLSPHPTEKQIYPKKMSNNLYISPMEKNEVLHSPNGITYEFCKSPAKALEKINEIVKKGKRNLPFDDETDVIDRKFPKAAPYYLSTIKGIIKDRLLEHN